MLSFSELVIFVTLVLGLIAFDEVGPLVSSFGCGILIRHAVVSGPILLFYGESSGALFAPGLISDRSSFYHAWLSYVDSTLGLAGALYLASSDW